MFQETSVMKMDETGSSETLVDYMASHFITTSRLCKLTIGLWEGKERCTQSLQENTAQT